MLEQIIPGEVPTLAAVGLGVLGLGLGILFDRVSVQGTVDKARKLMEIGIAYERRADRLYAQQRALTEPTQLVPTVELLAATATPAERLRATAGLVADRVRDALTPTRNPADWAPGEMTAMFDKIVEDFDGGTELTVPATPSPWVHPLAPRAVGTPPIVYAPREPQAAPRHQTMPMPVPRADTPSRARVRRSEGPGLTGRIRVWDGTLMGAVPPLELPDFPRPFKMPVPAPRLPHDPRRMAMLADDSTRQWRVKVVDA